MEAVPQGGRFDARFVDKPTATLTSGTYFERGDLLVSKITPSFENGKQALTRNLSAEFGYATTEVIPIRPKDKRRDPRFVFFYLLHPDVRSFVAEKMEGATGRQRVPDDVLLDLPVPDFEPVDESTIANVLQVVQTAIVTESRRESLSRDLQQATTRELFTRGLRANKQEDTEIGLLPATWEVVPLGRLGRIGNGSTPRKGDLRYWEDGTYPWLTSAKVYDREIVSADQFVTPAALEECHLPRLRPGSVLMAITGQGKTLGHCAVLRMHATINQHLAYLDTNTALANPAFIRGYLETQYEYLRQIASGGGSTKGALTCAFLRQLKVPLPRTLDEQDEIVAILDAIDEKIELHHRRTALLEDLFNSLLHKLMTREIRLSDLDLSALEQAADAEVSA
jgi:type I restriction enzyme S subunit